MANKPRTGSRKWEQGLADDPIYVRNTIRSLAERAAGGDKGAAGDLEEHLEKHPAMRSLVRELDDLATRAERAWVQRLCGTDALASRAAAAEAAELRSELLGPNPTATDRVLVSSVVVAHLAFQHASLVATQTAAGPEVRMARERLLTVAQRRLQDAVRGWELHRTKKSGGLRPRGGIKLFDPDGGEDDPLAAPASRVHRQGGSPRSTASGLGQIQ